MNAGNVEIQNNCCKDDMDNMNDYENENETDDSVTCNGSANDSFQEVDMIKCLDMQYFHVQDAPNEIIVTTVDDEAKDEEGCMEIVEDAEEVEESIENMENNQYVEESVETIVGSQNDDESTEIKDEEIEAGSKGQVFILPTLDDIKELIKCYCEQTSCRFVGQIKTKDFGLSSLECDLSGHRILWQDIPHKNSADDIITFDGIPHMCVGHYQFGCEFGTDLKAARKEKLQKMKEDGKTDVKTRNVKTPSKKCGCPAKIVVRQIIKFPEFKILKNTEGRKRTGTTKLKESLKNDRKKVKTEVLYVGRLPHISEHKYHELMEGREFSKEMVHPDLVVKAQEYFLQNKSNIEIYELIRSYVLNEMFWKKDPPDPKRRRFFPKPIDIRNIVGRIRRLSRFSEEEEVALRSYMEEVKKKYEDASIFFDVNEIGVNEVIENCVTSKNSLLSEAHQGKSKEKKDVKVQQTFIFCYQTHSQQWLVKRYNSLCYLLEIEATDSEMKCALPYCMYCLIVQTNVDFQVVGIIIVSKQRKYGLIEGLRCFREWNIAWDPDYLLIDYSEEIEEAVASVFPKATYFLNPHSCKKKWMQFLNTPSNDLQEHAEELLICLESMQYALTEESLTIFASLLESNEVWKRNDNLRTWFQNSWLHSANKWVFGYRPDDLIVLQHMKMSLDDSVVMYKAALGKSARTNGFHNLIQEVLDNHSIQEYEKYMKRNNELNAFNKQLQKKYTFPDYMQGLQVMLYPYVDVILKLANQNDFIITHDQLGLFTVQLQQPVDGEGNAVPVDNDNNLTSKSNEENGEQKGVVCTEFSYIEYSSKLDNGEFTVSFGDSRSYPFCTCTQWKFYKLPCVHICAVCCRLQGWRYQMFSPLYRSNPLFDLDYTCLNNGFVKKDPDVNSSYNSNAHFDIITGNIFESFIKVGANNVVLEQANEFLRQISKMTYIFKDRNLYTKIHHQLTVFVERLKTYLLTKGADEKLQIPLASLQSRSDFVALSIVNNLRINKPIPMMEDGGSSRNKEKELTLKIEKNDDLPLPRLQPISNNDEQCKYVICTLENKANSEKKGLDLINFDIKSSRNDSTLHVSSGTNRVVDSLDQTNRVDRSVQSIIPVKRVSSSLSPNLENQIKKIKSLETDVAPTSAIEQVGECKEDSS